MPVYTLPNFNLLCRWWAAAVPYSDPATQEDLPCQLYINPRATIGINGGAMLRCPVGVPRFQCYSNPTGIEWMLFEVPQFSGVYYIGLECANVHLGFPNEYRCVILQSGFNDRTSFGGVTLPLA